MTDIIEQSNRGRDWLMKKPRFVSLDVVSSLRCQPEPIRRYFLTTLRHIHVQDRVQDQRSLDADASLQKPRRNELSDELKH